MLVKNTGFLTSLPSTMFLTCGDMEVVGFPAQNAYKMAYGDENITFESRCKRETFEPVNGYSVYYTLPLIPSHQGRGKKERESHQGGERDERTSIKGGEKDREPPSMKRKKE